MKFLFGSHCHQPIGNFDFVFEQAMQDAYEPFFRILVRFPDIRLSAHFSGCLLEWIEEHHPEFLELIKQLVERGQIELLSSGFYEPVLASIPEKDRMGQIGMMNRYLEDRFGTKASGAWMTERVWEPQVLPSLVNSGIEFIITDDYHLKCAGLPDKELDGYYLTENDGVPLAVFPISEALRYTIPFQDPQETIEYLRAAHESGKRVVTMMDDGEKFGLWPGTGKLCYEEGWLERFFPILLENSEWLELSTPSEVLRSLKPSGVVYLPAASYFEMSEWTLPAKSAEEFSAITHELRENGQLERYRPFLRGGIWRNFLSKYPESNNMHKRMSALSNRINELFEKPRHAKRLELDKALRELYRSQCNCAYWHGVFGGLYLPHLRHAVYRHIIKAESVADAVEFKDDAYPLVHFEDLNMDGTEEVVLRSPDLQAIFAPAYGGALYELDFKPLHFNLINTLASRPEGYHKAISAPNSDRNHDPEGGTPSIHDTKRDAGESLREALRYGWHNRYSLLDHCLDASTSILQMKDGSFRELGDFVNQPYDVKKTGEGIVFSRRGNLYTDSGIIPLIIEKRVVLSANEINIEYSVTNQGGVPTEFVFAPELNFSLLSGDDQSQKYIAAEKNLIQPGFISSGEVQECSRFELEDGLNGMRIDIGLDKPAIIWYFPSQTVSQSESGFELNYQSSVIMPAWRLELDRDEMREFRIKLAIRQLEDQEE